MPGRGFVQPEWSKTERRWLHERAVRVLLRWQSSAGSGVHITSVVVPLTSNPSPALGRGEPKLVGTANIDRQPPEGAATGSWRLLSPFVKGDFIRSEGNEQTSK